MKQINPAKSGIALLLVALFLITFSCLLVYSVTQQTLRIGANAMPMQLAVDMQ